MTFVAKKYTQTQLKPTFAKYIVSTVFGITLVVWQGHSLWRRSMDSVIQSNKRFTMEWLIGFIAGFVADVFRSVFLPASTGWLSKFVPAAQEKSNIEDNKLTLEIMAQLQVLGKDPALARHARHNAETFLALIETQQDAFIENEIVMMGGEHWTQLEMNQDAARRADVARQQMQRAFEALQGSGWLQTGETDALSSAQERWAAYAEAQSRFAAAGYEGGSMAPLAYWAQMETATVSRTGELRQTFKELHEQRG